MFRQLIKQLKKSYSMTVLSGDNAGEKHYLQQLLGKGAIYCFTSNRKTS